MTGRQQMLSNEEARQQAANDARNWEKMEELKKRLPRDERCEAYQTILDAIFTLAFTIMATDGETVH